VLGAVPWQTLVGRDGAAAPPQAGFVGSTVVAQAWGYWPAMIVTGLVLITAFASVYGNLLGFSRIPYAAARDGSFLPIFARLHPTKDFPYIGVLVIGGLSLLASLFTLDEVIALCLAGLVLVQGVLQIVALGLLRARGELTPFRMPLYPLPAIVALVGWLIAFWYTGTQAIGLGVAWLVAGAVVYLIAGKYARWWPFVALIVCTLWFPPNARAATPDTWATWNVSAIVTRENTPVFTVDDKPFFVNGAAFFYERIPRQRWSRSLDLYKAMGINTIDLYVPWNWHEPSEGAFDFTGSTNRQRNLRALLAMIHRRGLKIILRPGPVIRNEWRNGGYPDWLLERPAYAMPLHDVLQGRYPATATLQNAHADAAAAQWMNNQTHRTYAARWLRKVLGEVEPWSHDVIAIALDDDQGAYIDNDTWPAPHWHRYIDWLRATVQSKVGSRVPLFINTYQMKVTASAPVWAWGNWYQSDAFSIGDHDLAQLMFSTALLQTQPGLPVMDSEFQAGWLQDADQISPRPADPTNTTLALHELLQMGARGIVNFPLQDTVNPPGWEAPWANHHYAWDAALTTDLQPSARYEPTRAFLALTDSIPDLATMQPKTDAAIAWLPSAYDAALLDNHRVAVIAAATIAVQQRCRALALTCRFVDLRFDGIADLRRSRVLIVPRTGFPLRFVASVESKLVQLARTIPIVHDAQAARALTPHPANGGIVDATLLLSPGEVSGVLDVINPAPTVRTTSPAILHVGLHDVRIPSLAIAARSAQDIVIGANGHTFVRSNTPPNLYDDIGKMSDSVIVRPPPTGTARADLLPDAQAIQLSNHLVRVNILPGAGARAFVFADWNSSANVFTSIGALRDDVAAPLPPSARDYIAAYTHPFPAGTFNRAYVCNVLQSSPLAQVRCDYEAPDLAATPVHFEKTFALAADARTLLVTLRSSAAAASISAISTSPSLTIVCPTGPEVTCTIAARDGYRLLRVTYPANIDTVLRFTLQGAAP
jgi:hypothetical protein